MFLLTKANKVNRLKRSIIIREKKIIGTEISLFKTVSIKLCDKKYTLDFSVRIVISTDITV